MITFCPVVMVVHIDGMSQRFLAFVTKRCKNAHSSLSVVSTGRTFIIQPLLPVTDRFSGSGIAIGPACVCVCLCVRTVTAEQSDL